MKTTTKALLASAFVFPGAGHLILKQRTQAVILIGIAAAATLVILVHVVASAREIVDRVVSGEVPADLMVIRQLVAEQQANSDVTAVNLAIGLLIVTWLIGVITTYRHAKA